jgi:hypothetical protein
VPINILMACDRARRRSAEGQRTGLLGAWLSDCDMNPAGRSSNWSLVVSGQLKLHKGYVN